MDRDNSVMLTKTCSLVANPCLIILFLLALYTLSVKVERMILVGSLNRRRFFDKPRGITHDSLTARNVGSSWLSNALHTLE